MRNHPNRIDLGEASPHDARAAAMAVRANELPGEAEPKLTAACLACERHVAVDAQGVPLSVLVTGANRHDSKEIASTKLDKNVDICDPYSR